MQKRFFLLAILVGVLFISCSDDKNSAPKPKAYFRLDIPKPTYQKFDTLGFPFVFQYPNYGVVERTEQRFDNKNWFNINYPDYGCKLYISFVNLSPKTTLGNLVNDSYNMTKEHDKFSSGVIERAYSNEESKVYGYVFDIKGTKVVSPYQFYITDSSRYFLRGALYFEINPNNDSLSPIIERVTQDLDYMISTFEWK
ncbi:MAG: hypothetical protein WCR29_03480 [Bacteroidales bacterium]